MKTGEPTNSDFYRFADVGRASFPWFIQSFDLMNAGRALVESAAAARNAYSAPMPETTGRVQLTADQQRATSRLRFPQVAFMLFGLAFEVFLKGLLVTRTPSLVEDTKLSKKLTTHDLGTLLGEAGIDLLPGQGDLVDRLSESVVWAGRYPIAKTAQLFQLRRLENGALFLPGTLLPSDLEAIEELWKQLVLVATNDPKIPKYRPL